MIVFGAPKRYVQGMGILASFGSEMKGLGRNVVLLADHRVMGLVAPIAEPSCAEAGVTLAKLEFGGEITYAELDRLSGLVDAASVDVVAAAGGGKAIDTGKLLSQHCQARFVSVPTVASNDSSTSHIAVVYDENHRLVGIEKNRSNPDLVLVDTEIISKAPLELLSAGVGDALVKRFEVAQCVKAEGMNVFGARSPRAAFVLANACYDIVREFTVPAFEAHSRGETNPAFENLVEACILMSGLAFESGGLSVSHGMTRGLSAIDGVSTALHGHQVAYGLLVQFELERRGNAFMEDMREFYRQARLPLKLADMGFSGESNSAIGTVAELSAAAPHMAKFERSISVEDIARAIDRIEAA